MSLEVIELPDLALNQPGLSDVFEALGEWVWEDLKRRHDLAAHLAFETVLPARRVLHELADARVPGNLHVRVAALLQPHVEDDPLLIESELVPKERQGLDGKTCGLPIF